MVWPLLDETAVLLGLAAILAALLAFLAWGFRAIYNDLRANGFSWSWLSGMVFYPLAGSAVVLMFFLAMLEKLASIRRWMGW